MSSPLVNYVSQRMPLRAKLLGPQKLESVVETAVELWPASELQKADAGSVDEEQIMAELEWHVRQRESHGSVIALLLLSSVISTVVRLILEWWWHSSTHRVWMFDRQRRGNEHRADV